MPVRGPVTQSEREKLEQKKNEEMMRQVWADAKARGVIETNETQEVFSLIQAEADKCRFEIVNQSERMAECTVHRNQFSHGVRLFPPHLWNLDSGGKAYYKENGQWVRWTPRISENKVRLDK